MSNKFEKYFMGYFLSEIKKKKLGQKMKVLESQVEQDHFLVLAKRKIGFKQRIQCINLLHKEYTGCWKNGKGDSYQNNHEHKPGLKQTAKTGESLNHFYREHKGLMKAQWLKGKGGEDSFYIFYGHYFLNEI